MSAAHALLFRPGPALGADARRVVLALLEDAARRRGGRVATLPGGGARLEAPPPVLDGTRDLLAALLRGRDATVADEAAARAPDPVPGTATEDRLAVAPLPSLLRRDAVLGLAPDGTPRPVATRVMPDDAALATLLGPDRAGEPWLSHARSRVAGRCLRAAMPGPLHLLVPEGPIPPLPPDVLPLLGPRSLAAPPARPFGVVGLGADAFSLLGALPAAATVLYLVPPVPEAAWAAIGPGRIILDGPADPVRAAARGALGLVGGPA